MKSLVFPLSLCIAVATAAVPEAQEVHDGGHYSGGGVTIAMDVGFTAGSSVTVQAISSSGWSNVTSGTPGAHHSDDHATCEDSGEMTVPIEGGTMTVRCKDGLVERKKNGKWIPMRRNWRMDWQIGRGSHTDSPGEETTSLPFMAVNEISYAEYRAMGFQADPTAGRAARRN